MSRTVRCRPQAIIVIGDVAALAMTLHAGDPVPPAIDPHRAASYVARGEMGYVRDFEVVRSDSSNARSQLDLEGVVVDL